MPRWFIHVNTGDEAQHRETSSVKIDTINLNLDWDPFWKSVHKQWTARRQTFRVMLALAAPSTTVL